MKPILILLLFISHALVAQNTANKIVIGNIDNIDSKILHEKRQIWVHVPGGNTRSGNQRYPVIYLFDGDSHFYSVMGMMQQLSQVNGNTINPQMIIVGITNTNRTRDLTPSPVPITNIEGSGGGEKFFEYIEKEVIPHVDSLYPTAPYRTLIGHSLGGLMVVDALINHTNLFNSFIAIDPSLWWNNQKLLIQAEQVLQLKNFQGKTLFLGIANTMPPGMDTSRIKKDTSGNSFHIRSILQFAQAVSSNPGNHLRFSYKYYNEDDHGSVPLITEYDALHFIFKDYRFKNVGKLFDPKYNADSAITAHYKEASDLLGYKVLPEESFINGLAYSFMNGKRYDKAYRYFKMNVDNYPQSFNVYDSMGDYYSEIKDSKNAIAYYKKALELNENPDSRSKYDKLINAK